MMAQAAYRVRIQQPEPGEAGVLASMIAPFVDLEVGLLESTLREGPAEVGTGLERREAEQLVRLFARLGARAELIEADDEDDDEADDGEDDDGDDSSPGAPAEIPAVRQTQPFDARALREALGERVEAASGRPTTGRPPSEAPPRPSDDLQARDSTQPFNSRSLRQALADALAQPPSGVAPPTRPVELEGVQRPEPSEPGPPRAPMRGRPARRPDGEGSEPPPRALPGMVPPSMPPEAMAPPPLDAGEGGMGSVDTASVAFESAPPRAPRRWPDSDARETDPARSAEPPRPSEPARPAEPARLTDPAAAAAVGEAEPPPARPPRAPFSGLRDQLAAAGTRPPMASRRDDAPPGAPPGPAPRDTVPTDLIRVSRSVEVELGGDGPSARSESPFPTRVGVEARAEPVRAESRPPRRPSAEPPAASGPPRARPISSAPVPRPPGRPASDGPVAVRAQNAERRREESARPRPVSAAPRSQPAIDEPPPRPSGGHPVPDRVRAAAIRERADTRPPLPPHAPWRAALLGLLPGMGQLYNGQRGRAVVFAVASLAILPWLYGIFDAWMGAEDINRRRQPPPDPAQRRAAVPGQLVLDFAVFVALAGAISLLTRDRPAPESVAAAPVTAAPATAAPPTAAPPTVAPVTAAPAAAPSGPRSVHDLLAEGRTHCGEGRFAECEARMLEIIEQRPDHIEAHRLLVDARTQRKAREATPRKP